ncbi:DUF1887 family CARF protein [bacterium]|nr:DUF1887 family CARF protein [bacterium]
MNLEDTDGPVLSALLAEDYDEIRILGYTNAEKNKPNNTRKNEDIGDSLPNVHNLLADVDPTMARSFVEGFCNTEKAHEHFVNWLELKLEDLGKSTRVSMQSIFLQKLNDTEGIYEAATEYLDNVQNIEGDKLVTVYLSPGTAVMAFVWAFVALRYPNLKKRLIVSSNASLPPETISLPNEWLEWHGRQIGSADNNAAPFDVIFHLFGEQRMPVLLGILQFKSKKHVFINSKDFPAEIMKGFIGNAGFNEIPVDPYDPEDVRASILNALAKMPKDIKVGFNLTGGTKLMYAGALAACRKVNATPFYFNSRNDRVVFLNDFETEPTKPITSVETFISLNGSGLSISKPGYWNDIPGIKSPERRRLTLKLWETRSKIAILYKELRSYNDGTKPFSVSNKHISAKLTNSHRAEVCISGENFCFENWPTLARYLSGGWLEEYVYIILEPFVKSGKIRDLRIGLEISFKQPISPEEPTGFREQLGSLIGETYQELDVVFTDGKRLYIVECKAGNLTSEQVMKLQNVVRYFGGIEGQGILASCFPPNGKVVRRKVNDAKNLEHVYGKLLKKELVSITQKLNSNK